MKVSDTDDKSYQALAFINAYVGYCNKKEKSLGVLDWINADTQVTNSFKVELRKTLNEQDSEMGPEADPIFDAQDYPDQGFELDSADNNNYLIVKGKDWPDFKVTIKMAEENGKWLVDGCGTVNIPGEMRMKR